MLPKWLQSNVFYRAPLKSGGSGDPDGFNKTLTEVHPLDANLISSEKANGKHVLMLDVDQESFIVGSSTSGHNHVYINADLDLDALKEIVDVLAKHGILQEGIKKQVEASGCLTFRPPGVKKHVFEDMLDVEEYKKHLEQQQTPKPTLEEKLKSAFGVPPAQIDKTLNPKYVDDIGEFKKLATGKSSKYYEAQHALKTGVYRVPVAQEMFSYFLKDLALRLKVDPYDITVTTKDSYDIFNGYPAMGFISLKSQKLAIIHTDFKSSQYMVEFRKEYVDSGNPVPEGWPEWEELIKVMSNY